MRVRALFDNLRRNGKFLATKAPRQAPDARQGQLCIYCLRNNADAGSLSFARITIDDAIFDYASFIAMRRIV